MVRIGAVQAGLLIALICIPIHPVTAAPGASVAVGETLFERNCVPCHGIGGKGGRGPNLVRPHLARAPDDAALKALIENGIPPEMPDGTFFTDEDIASLVLYVRSLGQVPTEPIPGDPERGRLLFARAGCLSCHIVKGRGQGFGPDLSDVAERRSASYLRAAIEEPAAHLPADFLWVRVELHTGAVIQGIRLNEDTFTLQLKDAADAIQSLKKSDLASVERLKGQTPMPAYAKSLSGAELEDLVAFLANPTAASPPAIAADHAPQVPFERLVAADREPGNWISYSRNLSGQRFSPLTEITPENVRQLKVKWTYQLGDPNNESSPLALDGVLYVTGANAAIALDARTGRPLWSWKRPLPADYRSIGFAHVNKGAAILGDSLYVTTLDGDLVALDLKSGAERWATNVVDYKLGYSITVAPLAIDGKIITGVSGGEAGVRGLIDAYDASTGARLWRFWTIPDGSDPAARTWAGQSAESGGGPTWVTGAYDPALKLLYWGVGNPSPDWNGDARAGDNLYTDSFVALDAATGKLRWYFQFTPHDTHDWDASHVPVLFNAVIKGHPRQLVANANRNGFYYVLDRLTGEFVTGKAYTKQTWAKGLDREGHAMVLPHTDPTREGSLLWPNMNGATIWFSPSYDPDKQLIYVPVRIKGATYFKRDMPFKRGAFYPGGGEDELPASEASGEIRAMNALNGEVRWRFPLLSPASSGVVATAGGLVFSGTDEGNAFAPDSASGQPLWNFQAGSAIEANPMSFAVDGHQYVAICADRILYIFGL